MCSVVEHEFFRRVLMKSIQFFSASLIVLLLFLVAGIAQAQQKLEPPKLTPTALTASEQRLLQEGIALHDKKLYAEAVAKYTEAIKTNQANDVLLYEAAYSFHELKEYDRAIGLLYEAAQYKGNSLGHIYVMLGNIFDERGDPAKAIETYQFGLKQLPKEGGLYYNLAITLYRQKRVDEAKKAAKQSARYRPDHPATQFLLANLFLETKDKIPALFAYSRFLSLEPATERSKTALVGVNQIMLGGVKKDGEKSFMITMDILAKRDEGDFNALDFALGMTGAETTANNSKTAIQKFVSQFESMAVMLGDDSGKNGKSKFARMYYIPYFRQMLERKLIEPFCYLINSGSDDPNVKDWLARNQTKVEELKQWSASFKWAFAE